MNPESPRASHRDPHLETFDAALVRALQLDGRASIRDLAQQLSASRDLISQRIKWLTAHGGLRVVAAIDPKFTGHHVLVHVRAEVEGPVALAAEQVSQLHEAAFVSITSGSLPLTFESRHSDTHELHETLDRIREFTGVRRLQVSTYAEVLRGFFVSPQKAEITVDTIDMELIGMLQRHGRISFRDLARTVHLSPSTVRARVNRLTKGGVILISALKSGGIMHSRLAIGVGITTSGDSSAVRRFFLNSPDVDFAARSHGIYDYIGTIVGASSPHLQAVLDEIRVLPGLSSVNTWIHYEVVKEDYTRSLRQN